MSAYSETVNVIMKSRVRESRTHGSVRGWHREVPVYSTEYAERAGMKYKEEVKDLFSVSEDYYFAHCISADFGMGKGIVVEFNKRFDMKHILQRKYPEYAKHFMDCKISGDCILEGRVLNLITKERYFHKPTLAAMKAALQKMKEICERESIYKIAMPTIGAGLDRLKWEDVATQIKNVFEDTEIEILVCKLNDHRLKPVG